MLDYEAARFAFSKHGFVRNGRGSRFTTFATGTMLVRVLLKACSAPSGLQAALAQKPVSKPLDKSGDPAEPSADGEVNEA